MARYCYPGITKEIKDLGTLRILPSGDAYLDTKKGLRRLDTLNMRIGLAVAGPNGEQILITNKNIYLGDEIKEFYQKGAKNADRY